MVRWARNRVAGGDAPWVADPGGFARSGSIGDNQESWMYIDVEGWGTVRFDWMVSSEEGYDYLEFYVDDQLQDAISGEYGWAQKTCPLTSGGTHRLKWRYVKDSSGWDGDDRGYVKAVTWSPGSVPPDDLAEALDSGLTFTTDGSWMAWGGTWAHRDFDYAEGRGEYNWLQTTVSGAGTITFWGKVTSDAGADGLEFYVDGSLRDTLSSVVTWTEKTYTISGTGLHTLRWRYVGADDGRLDAVQWTGAMPAEPDPNGWNRLEYAYDAFGRRIEKKYDGRTILQYVYDGPHCIAEYDAGGNLKRKYLYGPGVDEPICMIESSGAYAGTYYYHFDALGSVVALTNSSATPGIWGHTYTFHFRVDTGCGVG